MNEPNKQLNFGNGNSKLSPSIATFSLPAGHSCPFAKECYSKADILTGKIIDGKHCRFRCFAATNEARATNVRHSRWHNFNIVRNEKQVEKLAKLIQDNLPHGMDKVRVHVSGDFFNERYFLAWLNVAYNNPMTTFYGYTKALPHLVKYSKHIPNNFRFTASKGGTHDHLIEEYGLISAEVVFSPEEAEDKGLEIDHDDSLAFSRTGSFALLLHATQPAGTPASDAWERLRQRGIGGYNKEKNGFRNFHRERPVFVHVDIKGNRIVRFKPKKQKALA